ncbi:ABC transporter substrate-binding protein [Pseudonocardia sp. KRD291]|uniref:ABC transporter substrate-binding protein n=1 Tax=Pseudonocardia sp. KRD291 TaxID=2792007 RepID=UPI001C4A22FD|nr:ABC transporter substrate-binding protein [Pseudonocardia sp. KRD291]MBW0101936.1 ABC transporter substrate-binding protein [Pseudonocardia sp. KRD291]
MESCGRPLEISSPPQRAVTLEQNATEILLALGLADRMVGTSYQTDPVLPEYAPAYERVPVLASLYPSREAVLDAAPDFTYSTLSSAYAPDAAGSRADLAALGVPAYLSRHDCDDTSRPSEPPDFDSIAEEITELGRVFDVPDRAAALVATQRARVQAATEAAASTDDGRTVMWFYSGTTTPALAGGAGLPQSMSSMLGLRNVFDDSARSWVEGNWEEVAARDPDVIVLADLTRGGDGDSAAAKADFLRSDPVTSQLSAVRSGAIVTVPGSAMDPSIRSVSALEALATGLREPTS